MSNQTAPVTNNEKSVCDDHKFAGLEGRPPMNLGQTKRPDAAQQSSSSSPSSSGLWQLHGCTESHGSVQNIIVDTAVFSVGRHSERHLVLPCNSVSKHHADIIVTPKTLFVRDVGSTNGTYVNGRKITEDTPIIGGDTLQFSELEFRISMDQPEAHDQTQVSSSPEMGRAISNFDELINIPALTPWYQPVIDLSDGSTTGYEALARSQVHGLETPHDMFQTAGRLSMAVALSKFCRTVGMAAASSLPQPMPIFLNTHPSENTITDLIPSLVELRSENPIASITIELQAATVTSVQEINELRATLNNLKMQLAYDDFACEQSRLHELLASPPDILKFDIALTKNVHVASSRHIKLLKMMVQTVTEAGVIPLAEGIECQQEADVCIDLGFKLAQGYHFGRPAPVAHWQQ